MHAFHSQPTIMSAEEFALEVEEGRACHLDPGPDQCDAFLVRMTRAVGARTAAAPLAVGEPHPDWALRGRLPERGNPQERGGPQRFGALLELADLPD